MAPERRHTLFSPPFLPYVTPHFSHISPNKCSRRCEFSHCTHAPFLPYATPHFSHMPRPISPICHAPFLPCVTPHFSHMSRPISPIYITEYICSKASSLPPRAPSRRSSLGRSVPRSSQLRRAHRVRSGALFSDSRSILPHMSHSPCFPHLTEICFLCVFLSPGPFFPDGTHPFFSISHRDLFV